MAGSKSDAFEADVLKAATGQATTILSTTPLAHIYLALYTVAPTDAGGGTECTGGGYVRPDTIGKWGAPSGTSPTQVQNNAIVQTATSSGAWNAGAPIVAFALFDASSGGNQLYWATLTDQTQTITGANQAIQFPIGALTLTED